MYNFIYGVECEIALYDKMEVFELTCDIFFKLYCLMCNVNSSYFDVNNCHVYIINASVFVRQL